MSFINFPTNPPPVFPTLPPQAWSTHKAPFFEKTLITTAISGRECQINRQLIPRWDFTLTYGGEAWLRDETENNPIYGPLSGFTELQQLAGLFLQCLGSYGEFYYSDPDDNSRGAQGCGLTVAGVTTYQIYFTWGTGPFTPGLFFPVTGINVLQNVYINGILQNPSTYSLDSTRTKIVFNSAPPTPGLQITADFTFYFRCRFENDLEEFSEWALNLWEKKELKFHSVKP